VHRGSVHAAPCQRGKVCASRRSAAPHWSGKKVSNPGRCGAAGPKDVASNERVMPMAMEGAIRVERSTDSDPGRPPPVERWTMRAGQLVCYLTRTTRVLPTKGLFVLTTLRKLGMNRAFSKIGRRTVPRSGERLVVSAPARRSLSICLGLHPGSTSRLDRSLKASTMFPNGCRVRA
jgi:hypothetical protein